MQRPLLQEKEQEESPQINFFRYIISSLLEETFGIRLDDLEGIVLGGRDLMLTLLVAHACIFYLSIRPSSSFFINFFTSACIINGTVIYSTFIREKNQDENMAASKTSTTALDLNRYQHRHRQDQIMPIDAPKSKINLHWLEDVPFSDDDLHSLESLQPESTLAERKRFLKARKNVVKAASAQLGTYLEWRETNRIEEFFSSTFTNDEADWANAARGAMEITNSSGGHIHQGKLLPRIVSVFEDEQTDLVVCNNGARVVHVLPCQLDSTLAAPSTYALAVAMYLDRKLDRKFTEKVTVVIDIRSGTGWSNPSSVAIVPFIKLVVGLLNTYFPERLSRCILYPLPYTATLLFNQAKNYLDPDTAAKIQVCSGAGSTNSPIPKEVFSFIDKPAMSYMEERRKSFFVTT